MTTSRAPQRPTFLARSSAFVLALLVGLLGVVVPSVDAQDEPSVSDLEVELAERYAPIMMLKAQDAPCDADGEPYGPTSADIVLDNPEVLLRQVGVGDPVLMRAPGAADIHGLGEGFYLDFPGSALEPGCIYETDFLRYSADLPPTVYAHVVQQEGHPDQLAVQYWFYWYYNDWNNKHESDWEGIQLLFEASSVEEALAAEPVSVGYAQHEGGEVATWAGGKLEREGDHPVVYSSAGSHASYFGSALYLGRSAGEGFGCDNTDGPSDRLTPQVIVLPDRVDDPDDPLAWLAFTGRWGERQSGPFNGPTGLAAKARYLEPVDWHEDLRSSSVIIPAGDSSGVAVITTFCDLVEAGTGALISFSTSPTKMFVGVALLGFLARWAARRTTWERVESSPIRRRRSAGQIIRAAFRSYRHSWKELFTFGLVYFPTAVVVGLITALVALLPIVRDILRLAGDASGTNLAVAILTGSVANSAAYVAVNAMAAAYLEGRATGDGPSAGEAARLAWSRRGALVGGFLRASAVVAVLLMSVVGAPWGIRQLVRYQFLPHATIIEELDGPEALERSSGLVAGRWWHTALMAAVFNGLVAVSGLLVGLVVLLVFSGLPIWAFSALVTLTYSFVVPVAAVGQTLLYGDAVTEDRDAGAVVETATI